VQAKGQEFVPPPGAVKVQINSALMGWVDAHGIVLHSWRKTKRGTRGGGQQRRLAGESSTQSPAATSEAPSSHAPTPTAHSRAHSFHPDSLASQATPDDDDAAVTPLLARSASAGAVATGGESARKFAPPKLNVGGGGGSAVAAEGSELPTLEARSEDHDEHELHTATTTVAGGGASTVGNSGQVTPRLSRAPRPAKTPDDKWFDEEAAQTPAGAEPAGGTGAAAGAAAGAAGASQAHPRTPPKVSGTSDVGVGVSTRPTPEASLRPRSGTSPEQPKVKVPIRDWEHLRFQHDQARLPLQPYQVTISVVKCCVEAVSQQHVCFVLACQ
jgi:hypothetical protein